MSAKLASPQASPRYREWQSQQWQCIHLDIIITPGKLMVRCSWLWRMLIQSGWKMVLHHPCLLLLKFDFFSKCLVKMETYEIWYLMMSSVLRAQNSRLFWNAMTSDIHGPAHIIRHWTGRTSLQTAKLSLKRQSSDCPFEQIYAGLQWLHMQTWGKLHVNCSWCGICVPS